jgi:glycosyltransferase involved in cell wall biosynthesis
MATNCLIYEPDVGGHRLQHIRHLSEALLAAGCHVTIALQSDGRSHAEYTVHLGGLESKVDVRPVLDPRQGVTLAARHRRVAELLETLSAVRPDWCYVPYADGITQAAALESMLRGSGPLRRVPIEGQIMRGKYGYPQRLLYERLSATANCWLTRRSPWLVTHVLDPFALRGLEPLADENAFRLIPEPVEPMPKLDRRAAREMLHIPEGGRYISVVGGIMPRKGIDLLLAAFGEAKLAPDDRLLLVGKIDAAIRTFLESRYGALCRQGRIVAVDRYVTDDELHCGFLAADVVAVTHPRQLGSSGTLVRSAVANRPVLASDFGWVKWVTETFELGSTVNVSNTERYAHAIERALSHSNDFRITTAAERFCRYHTIANQKAHWLVEIERRRGIPLDGLAERIDWSWVLEAV